MIKVKLVISEPWDATLPNGSVSGQFLLHDKPLFCAAKAAYYKLEPVTPNFLIGQAFPFLIVAQRHEGPDMIATLNASTADVPVNVSVPKSEKVEDLEDCNYQYIGGVRRVP